MLAKIMPSAGKSFAIAGAALMSLAALAQVVALCSPWFVDTHHRGKGQYTAAADIEVTLWHVHIKSVYGKFEDLTLSWEEYCGPKYANSEQWCHKIRAVRATSFLAIFFAVASMTCFGIVAAYNRSWQARALLATLLSMACSVCAFGVSTFYPTNTEPAVDTPAFGFTMMCWATGIAVVTAIMSIFGMRYNFKPTIKIPEVQKGGAVSLTSGNEMGATFGKACVTAACALLLIAGTMVVISIPAPWWKDNHVHITGDSTVETDVVASLWSVEISFPKGDFEDLNLSWDEYCSPKYANSQTWCHKIRAVRATTILAVIFGLGSLAMFSVASLRPRKGYGTTGIATTFLSMVSLVCAFSVSLFYATGTTPAVNIPGFGFILVCLASLMTLWATLLSSYGLWYSPYSGFQVLMSEGNRDWKLSAGKETPPVTAYGSEAELVDEVNQEGIYVSERV